MHIQYNHALETYTAVDNYGVVLSIYDPTEHGARADWERNVRDYRLQ